MMITLVPTRELAIQVAGVLEKLQNYKNEYRVLKIYGGTSIQNQISILKQGVDLVCGTRGRILDLLQRGSLILSDVEVFCLDETDRMLDMGFKDPIEEVI